MSTATTRRSASLLMVMATLLSAACATTTGGGGGPGATAGTATKVPPHEPRPGRDRRYARIVEVPGAHLTGSVIDRSLADIATAYGASTAAFVAAQVEHPWH